MAGYRRPYTRAEEAEILKYIFNKNAYYHLRGNKFWKDMEEEGVIEGRTYQSLKEHFRKKIVRNMRIKGYYREFDEDRLRDLLRSYDQTAGNLVQNNVRGQSPESPKFPSSDEDD